MAGAAGCAHSGSGCARGLSGDRTPVEVQGDCRAGDRAAGSGATADFRGAQSAAAVHLDASGLCGPGALPSLMTTTFRPEPGQLPERDAVPTEYRWDLTSIC